MSASEHSIQDDSPGTDAAGPPPVDADDGSRTPLYLAAMASAAAGLVHAAAAGTHNGDQTLTTLFAVTAAVQLGWAALAVARPTRRVALAGAGIGAVALLAWVLSRTVGLPVIASLEAKEAVGLQDGVAALLGGLSMVFSLAAVLGARVPRTAVLRVPVVAVGAVALLALAVPAMAAEHAHGPSHEHGHGQAGTTHGHDAGDTGAATSDEAAHGHGDDAAHGAGDEHGSIQIHGGHGTEPIISLADPRVTEEQRAAAQELLDVTTAGMARFDTVESVQQAGYISIGDGVTGWEHYIHIGHMTDGVDMDPDAIESIVFKVYPDGTRQVASAMYILGFGAGMDDVPDIAGELTTWHDHQDLCWEGARVVGTTRATGKCERGSFRGTAPMLHVWMINNPCGPFAGIEGSHGSGCSHGHDEPDDAPTGDSETASGP